MWPSQRLASIGLDSRQRKSRARSRDRRGIRPIVTLLEERTLLSQLSLTVTTLADDPVTPISGQTTLRDAITQANASTANQVTINFAVNGTINLTNDLPNLNNNISLEGPGASNLTVQPLSSDGALSLFETNATVSLSGMTFFGFTGGGIYNNGTLTVSNSTFTGNGNSALGSGGAIHNESALTVVNSTFTGNSGSEGGAISNFGALTVSGSTFTDNSAPGGPGGGIVSGIYTTVSVSNSTFTGNSAAGSAGGGIYSDYILTVTGSTFSGNSAKNGGGIENNGTVTAVNSTFTDNSATADGGGINNTGLEVSNGTVTLTNSTVYGNFATAGGGFYSAVGTSLALNNSIVANNTGDDIYGMITSPSAYNLIGNDSGITNLTQLDPSNLFGTTADPLNPLLGQLANNGGPTQTMALLPGSPAIDAGSNALAVDPATGQPLAYDQRGVGFPRIVNGTVDIGAFESQGFTLTPVTGSTPQGTPVNSPFANPLAVIVTANNPLEPVAGGVVTFSAPPSGASANLNTTSPVTIGSNGQASVTATANAIVGQYTVSASTTGAATPASFVLTNQVNPAPLAVTVTTLADDPSGSISGYTTLRDAITEANAGPTRSVEITFAVTGTIDLTQTLPALNNNISIEGPGASNLTVQRDSSAPDFSVFTVDSAETVTVSGMTIAGGNATDGGGIANNGKLTVTGNVFTGNNASYGGGIYNIGTLTVIDSTFTENGSLYGGGGIENSYNDTVIGTLAVTNSTFISNSSYDGAGIYNQTLSTQTTAVTNCDFITNSAADAGGGFANWYGTSTVTNSTFTGNSAESYNSGGIFNDSSLTITNSTITSNGGGISEYNGVGRTLTLNNTIVAGNTSYDIVGQVQPTSVNNLIGNGTGVTNLNQLAPSNLIGTTANPLNPRLGPLAYNGGSTQTMALLPGSPAIDAGSNTLAVDPATGQPLAYDQRGAGFPRVVNGTVDIGAFESSGFTITVTSGSGQSTGPLTAFSAPLVATVTANNPSEPVAGGLVTFTAPPSGASATLSGSPATISATGTASVTAAANSIGGSYTVSATASGITTPASFSLTNMWVPTFSALTSPTIVYGTSTTTLTGHLGSGTAYPTGSDVSITLNSVTQTASVDGSGDFTTTFSTGSLGVAGGPYTVTYAFAGWAFTGVVAVALPRSSRASTDTTGRPLVFQATVPGLYPLRAA